MWTAAEKKLFPVLLSRLKKKEMPIKKEITMHQKKIQVLQTEANRVFGLKEAVSPEY